MKKINFALVGCGRISKKHLDILTGDLKEKANLIAICDRKFDLAKEKGEKYNVPYYSS